MHRLHLCVSAPFSRHCCSFTGWCLTVRTMASAASTTGAGGGAGATATATATAAATTAASSADPVFQRFASRRSPIYGKHGMVASSQPLATEAGLRILRAGGNAADAAVAVAAALNVTEPCSTGIGGDCFCLYYNAKTKAVEAINGSGRSPSALTLERARADVGDSASALPIYHAHTVTVPGACAGWCDTLESFGSGKVSMEEVLTPAIELAEEGFPVGNVTAVQWKRGMKQLKLGPHAEEMLIDGRAPRGGEVFKNPTLGATFRKVAAEGRDGFYKGRIAEALVKVVNDLGGAISLKDLEAHKSTYPKPLTVNYKGVDVYEVPPNGQGITALMALNLLSKLDVASKKHNSTEHLHLLIEAMRIAFADTRYYVADPDVVHVPMAELLSPEYADKRRALFDASKATLDTVHGSPVSSSDTVSFQVVDGDGNACSFINSNYCGFGTGLIPEGCGFTLQNRGHNFSMETGHPNVLAPNKRPYHTIIPGMALRGGELFASFSVMGGFMQPQGHVQVLTNLIDYGMNPQEALDAPRFCIKDGTAGGVVALEEGIDEKTVEELVAMGHKVELTTEYDRFVFGRGQIVQRDPKSGVICAGSDGRADGAAFGW